MGRDRLCLVGDLFRAAALLFLSTVVVLSVGGCKPSEESKSMNTKFQLPTIDQWSSAAKARVLFGHQSVGYNILDGVNTLAKEQGVTDFKIADISVAKDSGAAVIVHFEVGRNTDPRSKIDDFLGRIDATSGRRIDVAMMKFCYVDVSDDTRIDTLFKEYKEMVARVRAVLRRRAPHLAGEAVEVANLSLNPATHRLTARGNPVTLGPTEFRLLHFLMTHPERVHSRAQLLDQEWGDHVFVT